MEYEDNSELAGKKATGNGIGSFGMYESHIIKNFDFLINMPMGKFAVTTIKEIGSSAEKTTGCLYGLNRVFVAGRLPFKAHAFKGKIRISRTGLDYNASNYACVENKKTTAEHEQPSSKEIKRVGFWLAGQSALLRLLPKNEHESKYTRYNSKTFNSMVS